MLGGYYFYLSKKEQQLKERLIELFNLLQKYNFCVNAKECLQISLDKERISQEEFDERLDLSNEVCTDQASLKEEIISFFDEHTNLRLLIKYNDSSDLYLLTSNKSKIKYLFTSKEWKEIEKNFNKSNFECISNKEPEEAARKREEEAKKRDKEERKREKKLLLRNKDLNRRYYNEYLNFEEQINQKDEEYKKISQEYDNLSKIINVSDVEKKFEREDDELTSHKSEYMGNIITNKNKLEMEEMEKIKKDCDEIKKNFIVFRRSIPFNKTLSSIGGRKKRKTIRRRKTIIKKRTNRRNK
jgi:hypothetical protein